MLHIMLFFGLAAGNFVCIPLLDIPWQTACERSFFQGIALFAHWLAVRGE